MANHKQALKRHRQSLKARERNVRCRTQVKTAVKRALGTVESGGKKAREAVRKAESTLQHAASMGVIPRKRASRKVSRLARRVTAA